MSDSPTLEQARRTIAAHLASPPSEQVPLIDSFGRILASSFYAPHSLPGYSQSLFDGYAIARPDCCDTGKEKEYRIMGEVAAGDGVGRRCRPGEAYRIMTGALIPHATWKVIPQERCREEAGRLMLSAAVANGEGENIRRRGSEVRKNARLLSAGARLGPAEMATLAQFGVETISVYRRPDVAFFCSGSELVERGASELKGKKISSNRYLLAGMVQGCGGRARDFGSVPDNSKDLQAVIKEVKNHQPAIIISTGGMGPGRYDLLTESFEAAGGTTVFRTLRLRPGKATLFGLVGNSLYFGLPGPPPAVQALFHVLIKPALLMAQGKGAWKPKTFRASLESDMHVPHPGILRVREGRYRLRDGRCLVRPVKRKESANCYLFCSAGVCNFRRGRRITIQPFT